MKGVSALIASVLLIAVVVLIGGMILSWVTNYTKTSQSTLENRTGKAMDCNGASISIQDVYLTNGSAGTIKALVKNDGLVSGLSLTTAQALNKTGGNFTAINIPLTGFDEGDLETVFFGNVSMATCSSFSQIIVMTNCGNVFDTYARTPRC